MSRPVETLFGPCVARKCVECGQTTYGTPDYPEPRCEVCSIARYGVVSPAERIVRYRAPRGTLGPSLGHVSGFDDGGAAPVGGRTTAEATARVLAWRAAKDQAGRLAPHPAPETPCRLAGPQDMGRRAIELQRAAQGAGWHVQSTYARGRGVHGRTGKPTSLQDSIAVRCWGPDGRRVVMCWVKGSAWKQSFGVRWSPSHPLSLVDCDVAISWIRDTVATADREDIDGRGNASEGNQSGDQPV